MRYSVKGYLNGSPKLDSITQGFDPARVPWTRSENGAVHFEIQLKNVNDQSRIFDRIRQAIDIYGGYVGVCEAADDVTFWLVLRYPE